MKLILSFFIFFNSAVYAQPSVEECKNECCRKSFKKAEQNNYQIKGTDFCPNGTIEKYLKCDGSIIWCEPLFKKSPSKD